MEKHKVFIIPFQYIWDKQLPFSVPNTDVHESGPNLQLPSPRSGKPDNRPSSLTLSYLPNNANIQGKRFVLVL